MFSLHTAARSINTVLIIGSAALTGVFGWTFANNSFLLGIVFFAIFSSLSLLVPILAEYVGEQAHVGNKKVAMMAGLFAGVFFLYDVATNFGTAALFRETEIVGATNKNTLAEDARNDVLRLESRISTIKQQTAWQTKYLAPEAYDAEILKMKNETENGRNIFARSKECTDTTVASSQRVCQGIAEATANKSNALARQGLKSEMLTLERELMEAKARSAEKPTVASAAITHARNAGAFVTGQMKPDETTLFWSNYGLTFSGALACSLAGLVTSLLLGWMKPPRFHDFHDDPGYQDYVHMLQSQQRYLPPPSDFKSLGNSAMEPRGMPPHGGGADETIIIASGNGGMGGVSYQDPMISELLRKSHEANERAQRALEKMRAMGTA